MWCVCVWCVSYGCAFGGGQLARDGTTTALVVFLGAHHRFYTEEQQPTRRVHPRLAIRLVPVLCAYVYSCAASTHRAGRPLAPRCVLALSRGATNCT